MAAKLQGSVDTHQYGLRGDALLAVGGLAVLAKDDRRSDLPFREVFLERHVRPIQERKQAVTILAQSLGQPSCIGVFVLSIGKCIGNHRLDVLLADRTIIAVDCMFCNYGFQVFEDILDSARTCSVAALQRSAAVGTALEAVFLATGNPIGFRPASAFVARLCAPLALALAHGWLGVNGPLAGRR